MTKNQYAHLKIGDLVTKTGGPNKGILLKVLSKYYGFDGSPCLSAGVTNPGDKDILYTQNRRMRGTGTTCGAASCFKIVK